MSSPSDSKRPVFLPVIPELFSSTFLDRLLPASQYSSPAPSKNVPQATKSAPFMDLIHGVENRVLTENQAAAYASTLSGTLDAFSALNQATDHSEFESILSKSWNEDPLITIKLIWNLRSIHDGKAAREPFYRAFSWLYKMHPRSAIGNLKQLVDPTIEKPAPKPSESDQAMETDGEAEKKVYEQRGLSHGYFKDLLNILVLATTDQLSAKSNFTSLHTPRTKPDWVQRGGKSNRKLAAKKSTTAKDVQLEPAEVRIQRSLARDAENSEKARALRHGAYGKQHDALIRKLKNDKVFRALYIAIARIFADALAADLDLLKQVSTSTEPIALSMKMSLAGKWAPTIGACHDRATSICTAISLLLAKAGKLEISLPTNPAQLESQEFAHKVREMYTRWAISPLRRFIEVPERHMSANQWDKIIYSRVPSVCMSKSKKHFFKHDSERFSQYLRDVRSGKKKISGGALLPHELLCEAIKLDNTLLHKKPGPEREAERIAMEMDMAVVDEQWKALVRSIKDAGVLENSMALCDVSGSMGSIGSRVDSPIHPAVALSILLAQVAPPPWANAFITFSATPEVVKIDPAAEGLVATARKMCGSSWGMNTDFNAVFTKLILPMAVNNKLKPEDMIKRLFVFSDMEFDNSRAAPVWGAGSENTAAKWDTEHEILKRAFEAAGYELPEIVYWNLQGRAPHQVQADEPGVALMSGFSASMLKVFLEEGSVLQDGEEWEEIADPDGKVEKKEKKKITPVEIMLKALGKSSFNGLQVY